jgi:hypothetical protein
MLLSSKAFCLRQTHHDPETPHEPRVLNREYLVTMVRIPGCALALAALAGALAALPPG